ncbi:MAG: hypothetical protein LBG48_05925 [Rickettsiales bacterium]|jgi:hypothetical protein|nr:hypothetical protein [Rickettsiales bacterium]
MEKTPSYKVLEKEAHLFGLPLNDFYMVVLYALGYIALPIFVKPILGIDLGVGYYSLGIVFLIIIMKLMQRAGKSKYPKYLFSVISYKFLQPKVVQGMKNKHL